MGFWRDNFSTEEISFILDKIRKHRTFNNKEGVTVSGSMDYEGIKSILVSATGFEVSSDALRAQIVQSVIFSPELPSDFTQDNFRRVAYQIRQKLQNEACETFRVAIPIWNLPRFLHGTRKSGDVTLNFTPSQKSPLFKRITRERDAQRSHDDFKSFFTAHRLNDLRQCSVCLANVRANSAGDANEQASAAVYEILGLVNLARDTGKQSRISYSRLGKLPVSSVLIGPHTTTHFENGKLTHDGFWHEDWVRGPNQGDLSSEQLDAWENRVLQLEQAIEKSRWQKQCKSAAARYFKAFTNPNLEESFLEGWRLFEKITGTREDKISIKILRTSNVFKSNTEQRIIGKHLQLRRNRLAHGHAIKSDDEETLAFQMRQFVGPYLERYILNGFEFRTPQEFWEFLELPKSKGDRDAVRTELERRLELLEKAAEFRGERNP